MAVYKKNHKRFDNKCLRMIKTMILLYLVHIVFYRKSNHLIKKTDLDKICERQSRFSRSVVATTSTPPFTMGKKKEKSKGNKRLFAKFLNSPFVQSFVEEFCEIERKIIKTASLC